MKKPHKGLFPCFGKKPWYGCDKSTPTQGGLICRLLCPQPAFYVLLKCCLWFPSAKATGGRAAVQAVIPSRSSLGHAQPCGALKTSGHSSKVYTSKPLPLRSKAHADESPCGQSGQHGACHAPRHAPCRAGMYAAMHPGVYPGVYAPWHGVCRASCHAPCFRTGLLPQGALIRTNQRNQPVAWHRRERHQISGTGLCAGALFRHPA